MDAAAPAAIAYHITIEMMGVPVMMISDELAARLADEGITADAIAEALAAGALLADDDGTLVAQAQIGAITLWVRYRETTSGIEVVDAYCHRMQVD